MPKQGALSPAYCITGAHNFHNILHDSIIALFDDLNKRPIADTGYNEDARETDKSVQPHSDPNPRGKRKVDSSQTSVSGVSKTTRA